MAGESGAGGGAGGGEEGISASTTGVSSWAMDARSAATASDQLRVLVLTDVRSGTLAPGAALPPVRRLAEQLGLAPNTVAKVYRELERDGVLVTRGRGGTSVAPTGDGPQRQAQVAALEYARRVRELGLGDDAALATIAEALRAV